MKKVLSVLAALAVIGGTASCFGAAAVELNNYNTLGGAGQPVFYLTAGSKAGDGCYIQFYGGADANSLAPLVSTGGGNGVFSLAGDPGFFDGGIGNIAGLADGATATFVAHAWKGDGTPGAWATATQGTAEATWTQPTGANTPPNLPSPAVLNIPSMTIVVPEPTTLALGLIGAAGLLFFRRK